MLMYQFPKPVNITFHGKSITLYNQNMWLNERSWEEEHILDYPHESYLQSLSKAEGSFGGDTQTEGDAKTNLQDATQARKSQQLPGPGRGSVSVTRPCPTLRVPLDCSPRALLPMEFSRQEYRSWLPLPSRVSAKSVAQLRPWFRTSDPPKCERIDSCSFKPPNTCPFVRPVSGKKYK